MTEDQLEQLALTWFQDAGWEYRHGPAIAPDGETPERADYREVVLPGRLREALRRLNPDVPEGALDEVVHRVQTLHEPSLIQSNRRFHEALIDGVPVEVEQDGAKRGDRVRLIDFEHPETQPLSGGEPVHGQGRSSRAGRIWCASSTGCRSR